MPPIFTDQWRREQELAEKNRERDAQCLANASKAKHGVVIYAWSEDGRPPTVHEFQSRVQLYHCALGVWVGVDAGYVVELRAGDRIFLKASHVEDTPEFDKHLHATSKETLPHL